MPTPPLPQTRPVESFDLTPLLMVPQVHPGGVFVRNTLLKCETHDTDTLESTLTFSLSLADPKAKIIEEEMQILFKNRIYKTRTASYEVEVDTGKATVQVYAERLWYDLIYAGTVAGKTYTAAYLIDVLNALLAGTGWAAGQIDSLSGLSFSLEDGTVLAGIKSLASVFNLYVVFDDQNKLVHFLSDVGRDRGVYFTYERGISKATRTVDTTNLVTRLYGVNADGRTIAPANAGVPYIEDFSYTTDIRSATYNFRSGMSPSAMLGYLTGFLAARSRPTITYEYTPKGLIDRVDEVDRFEVFDKVLVFDTEFTTPVKSSITDLLIDYVDLRRSKINLGTRKPSLANSSQESAPVAGDGSEKLQFVQIKNGGVVGLTTVPTIVNTLDFTVVSDTQLQIGATMRIQLVGPAVPIQLTGYFLMDGDRLTEEIAYTATEAGWVTIGLPILVQGVTPGNHSLSLYLQVGAGTATIPINAAALWLASSGVAGGGSTSPSRSVKEVIETWWDLVIPSSSAAVSFPTDTGSSGSESVSALTFTDVTADSAKWWFSPIVSQSGTVFTSTGMVPGSTYTMRVYGGTYDSTQTFTADGTGTSVVDVSTNYLLPPGTYTVVISVGQNFTITIT